MPEPTDIQASHPLAGDPVFDLHVGGKMEVRSTVGLGTREDLSMAYTPGVARVCEAIAANPELTRYYTWVPNVVAVVTDGTAVLVASALDTFAEDIDAHRHGRCRYGDDGD